MSDAPAPNADQVAYWNAQAGRTWAELSDLLDRQIESVGLRGVDALDPEPGQRLLDVGCGGGQTTLALAEQVGRSGSVTGVDISRPMLEVARKRAEGRANVSFVEADAQTYAFEPGSFDAIFSRFGVMFFADPTAAFRNLLNALKPGGRLAFVCWRTPGENLFMTAPFAAAAPLLPPAPPPQPGAPGPFAFADPERVRQILGAAGFSEIALTPVDLPMGGNSVEDSIMLALRVGPLGAVIRDNPELAPKVREAVRGVMQANAAGGEVWMPGAVWIVTARRP